MTRPVLQLAAVAIVLASGAGVGWRLFPGGTAQGACNPDSHLDGRDVRQFVGCYLSGGGADCGCWDLDDSGAVDAPDVAPLVATLLGDVPFAVADHFITTQNTQVAGNVLGNDLDPHGPGTTASLEAVPAHGVVNLATDGAMTYTPTSGYSGTDSFTYRAVNGFGVSAPATVYLHVCANGFVDCDQNPRNGCETDIHTTANCGGCGVQCFNPHGTTSCATGECMPTCSGFWRDCDGNPNNGCETPIDSTSNCGGCGTPCTRANASSSCPSGVCTLGSCNYAYANCDGNDLNGCETFIGGYTNSYATAENVGSACADVRSSMCFATNWFTFATRAGRQGRYFRARANECNTSVFCCADLQARITLQVPAGVDYDLYAYSSSGVLIGSSTNGVGMTDQLVLTQNDNCAGVDDSFDYWIEVRFFGGESCSNWTLTFEGRN